MFDKKILCIGNETQATDDLVSILAAKDDTTNHGLVTRSDFRPTSPGYYHTSIVDVSAGDIVLYLARGFDLIKMLDQHVDTYPHWKSFLYTFKAMAELEKKGFNTDFRNNEHNKNIIYWTNVLDSNKSFCILPFMTLSTNFGHASLCMKTDWQITRIESLTDWANDPGFAPIRKNMLDGIMMPDKCSTCYEREESGQDSPRKFESLEAAIELRLTHVDDLKKIKRPTIYDIRPNNKCNIMCRICNGSYSHLIEEENKKINSAPVFEIKRLQPIPHDIIDFDSAKRIYWAGGEPTVMPEFYSFLRDCIKRGKTDFDLNIGTNGQKISNTLLSLLKEFPKVTFSVSIDGYKKVNDYIRWLSDFDTIRNNCHRILKDGHTVAFQTVFSIWNATRIHEIYEFYDREFPMCNTLSQPANGSVQSHIGPWHNPLRQQVLESMYRCRDTKVYYNNGRNANDVVEEIIFRFENYDYDRKILEKFFEYNDKLDQARGIRLVDYIPELEQARYMI